MTEKTKKAEKVRFSLILNSKETKDALDKVAYMKRKSANELINLAIEEYIKANGDAIAKYDELFSEEAKA